MTNRRLIKYAVKVERLREKHAFGKLDLTPAYPYGSRRTEHAYSILAAQNLGLCPTISRKTRYSAAALVGALTTGLGRLSIESNNYHSPQIHSHAFEWFIVGGLIGAIVYSTKHLFDSFSIDGITNERTRRNKERVTVLNSEFY